MSKQSSFPGARDVAVSRFPIELAQFLKFAGLFGSGGEAKEAVVAGDVQVNGTVETRRGRKLIAGDKVTIGAETLIVREA
ncbi:MAG TPA: RNA-binding S4 domain-containing protein [Opitutaceae bacterium]